MEEKKKVGRKGRAGFITLFLFLLLFLSGTIYGVDNWDANTEYP